MSRPSPNKRAAGRATGANTLITAASLALTVSGWAVLARSEAEAVQPVVQVQSTAKVEVAPPLPPMPTLVPTPDWAKVPLRQVEAPAPPPVVATAVPPPNVVVPPPAAVLPPQPVAPEIPPRPATVTRSSR